MNCTFVWTHLGKPEKYRLAQRDKNAWIGKSTMWVSRGNFLKQWFLTAGAFTLPGDSWQSLGHFQLSQLGKGRQLAGGGQERC